MKSDRFAFADHELDSARIFYFKRIPRQKCNPVNCGNIVFTPSSRYFLLYDFYMTTLRDWHSKKLP